MSSDPLSAVLDGMFSLASGGLAMTGSAIENRKQRKWAAAEAQKARDWAEQMSNTAHQREVDDLRAAGLNPILSATGGNGAATPTAATASSPVTQNPTLAGLQAAASIYNALSSGQLNAASAKKADADADKAKAETEKLREQTKVEKAKGDAVEKSRTWLERGWDYLTDFNSFDDIAHTFGVASNAGDVERHKKSLENKKEHNRLLEQERLRNLPHFTDVDGSEIRSIPNDWKYVSSDFTDISKKHEKSDGSFTYYNTYRKPNGDLVRVRRRGYNVYK